MERWPVAVVQACAAADVVVAKAALEHVFSEFFGFPCQAFHRLLHTHHHPSSRAGKIGQ
jgi:hypothetical protein